MWCYSSLSNPDVLTRASVSKTCWRFVVRPQPFLTLLCNIREPFSLGWQCWEIRKIVFYTLCVCMCVWSVCIEGFDTFESLVLFFSFWTIMWAWNFCAHWNEETPFEIWVSDFSCKLSWYIKDIVKLLVGVKWNKSFSLFLWKKVD